MGVNLWFHTTAVKDSQGKSLELLVFSSEWRMEWKWKLKNGLEGFGETFSHCITIPKCFFGYLETVLYFWGHVATCTRDVLTILCLSLYWAARFSIKKQ